MSPSPVFARTVPLLGLCALGCAYTVFSKPQPLVYGLPPGQVWERAHHAPLELSADVAGYDGEIDEYVLEGDDIEDWHELVTVLRTYKVLWKSRLQMFEDLQRIREEECPGSTRWNLVEDSDERLLFESWAAPCQGFPDVYEVAVVVDGKRDRVRLSYAVKSPDIDDGTRERWLAAFRAARLEDSCAPPREETSDTWMCSLGNGAAPLAWKPPPES